MGMLSYYLPEIIIILNVIFQIILSFFNLKRVSNVFAVVGLICALLVTLNININPILLHECFFKSLIIISSLLVFLLKTRRIFIKKIIYFNTLFLASIFFLILIIDSNNFLSLYVNIELFSLCLYFMFSIDLHRVYVSQTIKYMFLSVISSVFLLLGVAFLYGTCGSINFIGIKNQIDQNSNYSLYTYIFPYLLIFVSLFFKLGAFPLGNWLIDIYNSIDTKLVTYISVVPKLAILSVFIKVFSSIVLFETTFLIIMCALITGIFGAIYGIKTSNLKVIMACSSYVNICFMLIAFSLYTRIALAGLMFYLITYIFLNIGSFTGIIVLEHSNFANKDFIYNGYFYKNKLFSICFAINILALWGLPLTSGFVSKIYLLIAILNSGLIILPVVFAIFTIMLLSTVFYLKIIKNMFIKNENCMTISYPKNNKFVFYLCTFLTIAIGIAPMYFIRLCEIISYHI